MPLIAHQLYASTKYWAEQRRTDSGGEGVHNITRLCSIGGSFLEHQVAQYSGRMSGYKVLAYIAYLKQKGLQGGT